MTKIYIDTKTLYAEVQGHAGAGKAGEDIVCAGITSLCFALEAAVKEDESFRANTIWHKERVLFRADCWPKKWTDVKRCQQRFKTIAAGFRRLAKEYPGYIDFREE